MKKFLTQTTFGVICLLSLSHANDNVNRSLKSTSIVESTNSYNFNKNVLQDLKRRAISRVGKELNIDTKLFDDSQKFSLYFRIASTSKIGFKYRF